MTKGTVTYFNDQRGWGIINGPDVNKDIYVHYTVIKTGGFKTLRQGQQVDFEWNLSDDGPRASAVYPTE